MIPIRDANPTKSIPFMTILLMVGNVAVFAYEIKLLLEGRLEMFLNDHALIAARFLDENNPRQWVTAVTSMFLHGGFAHLIGNMLYLWVFGNNIEDRMGRIRFLIFYLLCGGAAAAAQMAIHPAATVPMIGASGAVAGVLGAYLLLFPGARVLTLVPMFVFWLVEVPAVYFLLFWIGLQFLYALPALMFESAQTGGGVAWWAHIGGFTMGMLLIHIFKKR